MSSSNAAIADIAARYESHFRERLRPIRKVGREAEFPVVWPDGRAGDVSLLWETLIAEGGFTPLYDDPATQTLLVGVERANIVYSVEVGRGTVELSIGPYDDLWELQIAFDKALARLKQAVASRGMRLLGFGIQPRTRPSAALMTPRRHYRALYDAIGTPWLYLTTTASDQFHVDICRAELMDAINWMNLLSGPLIALCANSSVYAGRRGRFVSGREGLLHTLGEHRYGMTPRYYSSLEEFIEYICRYDCYVLKDRDCYRRFNRPFTRYLSQHGADFSAYVWHEHYTWNSARARIKNSTVEVRPACQQPPGESLAAGALSVGFVESLPHVREFVRVALGPDPWPAMLAYRRAAVQDGLAAREPAPGFLADLVSIAEGGLKRRGRGEEKLLAPIWNRLDRQRAPGQDAGDLLRRRGMAQFIEAVSF